MTTFTDLASMPADPPAPVTGRLRLAVAAYLARFKGSSREHAESDLRCYLACVLTRTVLLDLVSSAISPAWATLALSRTRTGGRIDHVDHIGQQVGGFPVARLVGERHRPAQLGGRGALVACLAGRRSAHRTAATLETVTHLARAR